VALAVCRAGKPDVITTDVTRHELYLRSHNEGHVVRFEKAACLRCVSHKAKGDRDSGERADPLYAVAVKLTQCWTFDSSRESEKFPASSIHFFSNNTRSHNVDGWCGSHQIPHLHLQPRLCGAYLNLNRAVFVCTFGLRNISLWEISTHCFYC
jgi:hypothetical protein